MIFVVHYLNSANLKPAKFRQNLCIFSGTYVILSFVQFYSDHPLTEPTHNTVMKFAVGDTHRVIIR